MNTIIASGYDANGISSGIADIAPGQVFNLELIFDRKLSRREMRETLDYIQDSGIYPSRFAQGRNNVLHIQMVKPEGVAMPSLAVIVGATALAGLITWRITTESALSSITSKIIPVALITMAGIVLVKIVDKNKL